MRRWIVKEVGLKPDGTAKDCVVFYDYLKLMDTQGMSQDLQEYHLHLLKQFQIDYHFLASFLIKIDVQHTSKNP